MWKTVQKFGRKPGWWGFALLAGVLLGWGIDDRLALAQQTSMEHRPTEEKPRTDAPQSIAPPLIVDSPPPEDRGYWDAYRKRYDDEVKHDWQAYQAWRGVGVSEDPRISMRNPVFVATFPEGVQAVWPQQVLTKDGRLFDMDMLLQRRLGHRESRETKTKSPYLLKLSTLDRGNDEGNRGECYSTSFDLWSNGSLELSSYRVCFPVDQLDLVVKTDPYWTNERKRYSNAMIDRFEVLSDVVDLQGGGGFHLALRRDGRVWVIDGNDSGRERKYDRPVAGLTDVTAIAAGHRHALALKSDGSVWMWGWRAEVFGENGVTAEATEKMNMAFVRRKAVPQRVKGLHDVIKIAATATTSLALTKEGAVWSWGGEGSWGEHGVLTPPVEYLADNNHGSKASLPQATRSSNAKKHNGYVRPFQIPGVSEIVDIAAGPNHVLALKRNGTVWRWGNDYGADLVIRNDGDRATPVQQLKRLDNVNQIFAGDRFSGGVRQGGSVWYIDYYELRFLPRFYYEDAVRVMGQSGTVVDVHFSIQESDIGSKVYQHKNLHGEIEIGIFKIDDPSGRVDNLRPGDPGYAQAALAQERAITLRSGAIQSTDSNSAFKMLQLDGGQMLGFYLISGGDVKSWRLAHRDQHLFTKLTSDSHSKSIAYFSFPAANLDGKRHFNVSPGGLPSPTADSSAMWSDIGLIADKINRSIFLHLQGVLHFDERFLPRPSPMTSTTNTPPSAPPGRSTRLNIRCDCPNRNCLRHSRESTAATPALRRFGFS